MNASYRGTLFLIFFAVITSLLSSQEKDFGIWYTISAKHKLNKKLELDLFASVRTFVNASKTGEMLLEGG